MPASPQEEVQRDLGFGAVVSSESRQRLLNHDGSFNVVRHGLRFWSSLSLYHWLLTMSWPRFLLTLAGGYVAVNVAFAGAYLLCGSEAVAGDEPALGGRSFLRAFFLSVETLSTVGYGRMVPASLASHLVMTVESLAGMLCVALATGLVFARFSRPTAKIEFSRNAIVGPYRGGTGLMFRVVNLRQAQLFEVEVKVLLAQVNHRDGRWIRTYDFLSLERERVAFFPLSWTVVHPIREDSPLWGMTAEDLRACRGEILIQLAGIDEVFSQSVHSRTSYTAEEVVWNVRFARMFDHAPTSDTVGIDVGRLHDLVSVDERS